MKPSKHSKYIKGLVLIFALYVFIALILSIIPVNPPELEQDNNVVTDTKSFIFTAAGDYGATNNTKKVLDLIGNSKPDFNLAIGDLSYRQLSPELKWCEFVKSYVKNIPFLLISGNHESVGEREDGDIDVFSTCLPFSLDTSFSGTYGKQYYFDYPKVNPVTRFILVAPGIIFEHNNKFDFSKGGRDYLYVQKLIKDAKNSDIPWIVVGMHKVCISTESKNCEVGEDFVNMLIEEGVSLVLSGHVHAYERSFPLTCIKKELFDSKCISNNNKDTYNFKDGTIFATVGTGGVDLRDLNSNDSEASYFAKLFGLKDNHYGVLKSVVNNNTFSAEFIDANTREIVDSFNINR